jgi:hypothetical protein
MNFLTAPHFFVPYALSIALTQEEQPSLNPLKLTWWLRLLRSFILVSAECLLREPSAIMFSTSSGVSTGACGCENAE